MGVVTRKGVKIDRYRATEEQVGGNGKRLGIAYLLPGGDVVYVPSDDTP